MRATRWFVLGLTSGILLLWCMMRISALAGDIPQTAVQALTAALALSALAMVAVARKVTTPRLITWLFVLIDIAANLWFSQPGKSAMLVITLLAALLLFTLAVAVGLEIQSEDQKEVINVFICGLSCSLLLQNLAIISGISSLLIVCTPLVLAIFCPPLVYKLMARLRPAEVG